MVSLEVAIARVRRKVQDEGEKDLDLRSGRKEMGQSSS